jgi:limonene-1,2-epoxide hydrolase
MTGAVSSAAVSVVEDFLTAYWTGDTTRCLELTHDDFEWINVALPRLERKGKAVMAALLAGNRGSFPEPMEDGEHVSVCYVSDGNTVFGERLDRMKFRGSWIEVPCNAHWEVVDGTVRMWKDYFDLGAYIRGMNAVGITIDLERYA